MRSAPSRVTKTTTPEFLKQATEISKFMKSLSEKEIASIMKISPALAKKTSELIGTWTDARDKQTPTVDSFLGDIYSGLQAHDLDARDRTFAQKHLRIISGLYGILKPLDGIFPYRLEMAYKLPNEKYRSLYSFWGDKLAKTIKGESIINLSSAEYGKAIFPNLENESVITPNFLSVNPKTKQPTFVVVHAKIARGACAHWLIKNRVTSFDELLDFNAIGYKYNKKLSAPGEPVFVAKEFGGLGLSVRLS